MKTKQTLMMLLLLPALLLPAPSLSAEEAGSPESLLDAVREGTPALNLRLRAEYGDEDGKESSTALTARTRLAYTTGVWQGLSAGIEFEATRAVDTDDYNAAGVTGNPDKTVIADPPSTELNQAFLRYTHGGVTGVAGRQRLVLDNARFVGDVGWRQNNQTYDAATLTASVTEDLTLLYGYIGGVNRIFGSQAEGVQRRLDSDSHIVNLRYTGLPLGTVGLYGYFLDFDNAAALSSDTFGAYLDGRRAAGEGKAIAYRLEAAAQRNNSASAAEGDALYFAASGAYHFGPSFIGLGYERLEADVGEDSSFAFSTPLATLHAFNGWADKFLATPANGLEDINVRASTLLPGQVRLTAVHHWFSATETSDTYGRELNLLLVKPVGSATLLAKYANYRADDFAADTERLTLELNFAF
ncbi:MAG: alginate export family protein [Verrucomicrobia bacterium]|nr:alginate export family protein [Verrucomicrobiota bacterium]MCH8528050.1 alginate export family protein [Kiritimatiellia bacterium]